MLKNPPQAIPFDGSELTFVKNPLEKLDVTDGGAYVIDVSVLFLACLSITFAPFPFQIFDFYHSTISPF